MASECIYYAWKYGGYYCNLANKEVDDDTVHRFCWTYYSDECPLRKNQSSSGCYITSACVRARGLPDDCLELETLRAFRDGYLASQPGGREDIEEYYAKAPKLVCAIDHSSKAESIYEKIYSEMVQPCVKLIQEQHLEKAYTLYKQYSVNLMQQFGI